MFNFILKKISMALNQSKYRPPTMATIKKNGDWKEVFSNAFGEFETYEDYSESLQHRRMNK